MKSLAIAICVFFMSAMMTLPAEAVNTDPNFSFNVSQMRVTYNTRHFNHTTKSHITEYGYVSYTKDNGREYCARYIEIQLMRTVKAGDIKVGNPRVIDCRGKALWANAPAHKNYFIRITSHYTYDDEKHKFVGEVWHSGRRMP